MLDLNNLDWLSWLETTAGMIFYESKIGKEATIDRYCSISARHELVLSDEESDIRREFFAEYLDRSLEFGKKLNERSGNAALDFELLTQQMKQVWRENDDGKRRRRVRFSAQGLPPQGP